MTTAPAVLAPPFLGPIGFLLSTLVVIVLVVLIARLVLGLAWKLVVIGAVVLGALWLLGAISGPPGLV